jgi:hypothetical protein
MRNRGWSRRKKHATAAERQRKYYAFRTAKELASGDEILRLRQQLERGWHQNWATHIGVGLWSVLHDLGTALAALIIVGSVPGSRHAPGECKISSYPHGDRADAALLQHVSKTKSAKSDV